MQKTSCHQISETGEKNLSCPQPKAKSGCKERNLKENSANHFSPTRTGSNSSCQQTASPVKNASCHQPFKLEDETCSVEQVSKGDLNKCQQFTSPEKLSKSQRITIPVETFISCYPSSPEQFASCLQKTALERRDQFSLHAKHSSCLELKQSKKNFSCRKTNSSEKYSSCHQLVSSCHQLYSSCHQLYLPEQKSSLRQSDSIAYQQNKLDSEGVSVDFHNSSADIYLRNGSIENVKSARNLHRLDCGGTFRKQTELNFHACPRSITEAKREQFRAYNLSPRKQIGMVLLFKHGTKK